MAHGPPRCGGDSDACAPCRGRGPGTYDGLRAKATASSGERPGVLTEPEAQVGAVTVGFVAAQGPLLSTPLLANSAGDTVDARTVKFLLKAVLQREKEEERKVQGEVGA